MPRGFLPVFRCASEDEAKRLLVAACPRNVDGDFVAAELAEEQTLEALAAFAARLAAVAGRLGIPNDAVSGP